MCGRCSWADVPPQKRKAWVVLTGMAVVLNSTLGSALPSGASSFMAEDFQLLDAQQLTLPMTCYLIGYILGPVVFGPLSETYVQCTPPWGVCQRLGGKPPHTAIHPTSAWVPLVAGR